MTRTSRKIRPDRCSAMNRRLLARRYPCLNPGLYGLATVLHPQRQLDEPGQPRPAALSRADPGPASLRSASERLRIQNSNRCIRHPDFGSAGPPGRHSRWRLSGPL